MTRVCAGTVPYRNGKLLLVKSSDGTRWVFPKGGTDGLRRKVAAIKETWEEAGAIGKIGRPIRDIAGCTYFVFEVVLLEDRYPEAKTRSRTWATPEEALLLMERKFHTLISRIKDIL